ncbi:MAG: uracil-DNA glycosylase [Anaerolineae bacterium]|nr:uracil-DNA glycosylase [Anaerolineae bacterium]
MNTNRNQALESLYREVQQCTRCVLHTGRTFAVPGAGPIDADIMFIGEAPGFHEDQQGIPFVGRAGQFLNELLEKNGIDRKKVYIGNVIKCRPPGNREPKQEEVDACLPYLERQIELVNPKVIVTLGRYSMALAYKDEKISVIHGQPRKVSGRIYFPMYHPAAILRQPSLTPIAEADFALLRNVLAGNVEIEEFAPPPQVEQLAFF